MAEATLEKGRKGVAVQRFTVQGDHPRNCDLILQGLPGIRLRSTIRGDRTVENQSDGRPMIPPDQAAFLGQFPVIPGQLLEIDPEEGSWSLSDPLTKNKDLCEQIKKTLEAVSSFRGSGDIRGVPATSGTVDADRMKTLCREMARLLALGHVKVVKGACPTLEQCDGMPGDYLLNPGSTVRNSQPRLERDLERWAHQLDHVEN